MTGSTAKRDRVIPIRLTEAEAKSLGASAMTAGVSRSDYGRAILRQKLSQPKPTLAAAGRLLAICRILIEAAEQGQLPPEQKQLAQQRAAEVIAILGDARDGNANA